MPAAVSPSPVGAGGEDRQILGTMPLEADPWPLMMSHPRTVSNDNPRACVDPIAIGRLMKVIMQAME